MLQYLPSLWRCSISRWGRQYEIMNALLLFSCWVVSDSLWPHGLQHARLSCPSLSPGVSLNSCPVSWWCHPTISSSFSPFSLKSSRLDPTHSDHSLSSILKAGRYCFFSLGPHTLTLSNCDAGEDSWESLGQQGDQTSQSSRKSTLNIHWKDW